jgi:hypothetical protein
VILGQSERATEDVLAQLKSVLKARPEVNPRTEGIICIKPDLLADIKRRIRQILKVSQKVEGK